MYFTPKSWTSPMLFMARLTHNSPAVPATIMKKKSTASRTIWTSSRAGRGAADNKNANTNHRYAKPTQWRNHFTKKQITQDRDREVGQHRERLHVTVIRPRQQQHVHDKIGQQAADPQPDIAGTQRLRHDRHQFQNPSGTYRSHALHAFAEQHISQRAQNNADKHQGDCFQLQPAGMRHVFVMSSS